MKPLSSMRSPVRLGVAVLVVAVLAVSAPASAAEGFVAG
jgi:hypothetical protein